MYPSRSAVVVVLVLVTAGSIVPGIAGSTAAGPGEGDVAGGAVGVGPAQLQSEDLSGSLSKSAYKVTRGNSVEITFSHSERATLYVGGDTAGYLLKVNVSGSGTDTVTIHTYNSTAANPDAYVDGGDAELVYPTGGLAKSLVPAVYLLNLTVGGVTQDLGRLEITERPQATMTTHVAPGSLDVNEASFGDVKGEATPGNMVAKGDYAIVEVNATGLGAAIDKSDLDGDGGANGIEVYFEDLDTPPNKDGDSFAASDRGTVTPFWDDESETLLLAWDTRRVDLVSGDRTYNVTFRIEADHNELLREDSLEANVTIRVVNQALNIEAGNGSLTVYPWESDVVSVSGTTSYAPGTVFEVRARAFEPRPFLKKRDTTVTDNRTFSTEIDFGGEARGIEVPLWIQGHRDTTEREIHLRAAEASFDFANQTAENGTTAWIDNVSLSVGGHLVLRDLNGTVRGVSEAVGEEPIGAQNVTLDPPLERSAYLTATAVMDWNQNGSYEPGTDRAYTLNGSNVSQRAVVFVPETGAPKPPSAVNNTTTSNTTTTPLNTTINTTTGNETTAGNTPTVTTLSVQSQDPLTPGGTSGNAGLTLALPVASLLAAALLLRRRHA